MKLLRYSLAIVASLTFLVSCGPSTKLTGTWTPEEVSSNQPYKKVFILAMTDNVHAKTTFESAVEAALKAKGIESEMSSMHFPPTFVADNAVERTKMITEMKALGCDAVLVMSLMSVQEESRYVSGGPTYPAGAYGYYGGFGGYYGYRAGPIYSPGYYVEDKTYFLESNVYDVESESLQWSSQSKTYNPGSVQSFSQDFAQVITTHLVREKVVAAE